MPSATISRERHVTPRDWFQATVGLLLQNPDKVYVKPLASHSEVNSWRTALYRERKKWQDIMAQSDYYANIMIGTAYRRELASAGYSHYVYLYMQPVITSETVEINRHGDLTPVDPLAHEKETVE